MTRRHHHLVAVASAVGVTLAVTAAAWHWSGWVRGASPASGRPGPGVPLAFAPGRRALLDTPAASLAAWSARVRPPSQPAPISGLLHVLRLHGLEGRFDHPVLHTGRDVLRLLTDESFARSYYGAPAAVRTRHGIEFIGGGASVAEELTAERHRDQCLAALAELGVPLSTPVRAGGEELTLRAALEDSLANFHPRQQELQWTAVAYALYLPPRRGWVNKFGERFTFDDVVDGLIGAPLEDSSCGGTHQGFALTLLYRVDRERSPILSRRARDLLGRRLRRTVDLILAAQAEDGSWTSDWAREQFAEPKAVPSADRMSAEGRLLVTSHLAEWLLYLPPELAPPDEPLRRAGLWLRSQLERMSHDLSDRRLDEIICPYTHSAAVVRALSRPG